MSGFREVNVLVVFEAVVCVAPVFAAAVGAVEAVTMRAAVAAGPAVGVSSAVRG